MHRRLLHRLDRLVENSLGHDGIQVGFFTIGYNYLIQLIPLVIVGRSYGGACEFGVVTQSAIPRDRGRRFSLIVTQFQQITNFATTVVPFNAHRRDRSREQLRSGVEVAHRSQMLFENLTLREVGNNRVLVGT